MIMSEQIGSLAVALSNAQTELEHVTKDKKGYGYTYADLASCFDAIKKPAANNKLAISQLMGTDESGNQVLITLLLHESGQWIKSVFPLKADAPTNKDGRKSMNDMQALGSAISYAARYSLCRIFGLAQEDDDAASTTASKPFVAPAEPDYVELLKKKCTENHLNVTEFAKYHHIESKNINSVKHALKNFHEYKDAFVKYQSGQEERMAA